MISNEKLNKAGIMDGNKTKLKKFETETAGEYAKRKQFKHGGKACAQLTGWGKARKR